MPTIKHEKNKKTAATRKKEEKKCDTLINQAWYAFVNTMLYVKPISCTHRQEFIEKCKRFDDAKRDRTKEKTLSFE